MRSLRSIPLATLWPAWPVGRLAMTYNEPAMTVEWVRNDVERARDDGMRSLW